MKKTNEKAAAEKEPRLPLRIGLEIFRGVKMPWLYMGLSFAFTIVSAFLAMNTATFAGDAVDASGAVPTAQMVRYVLYSLGAVLFLAGNTFAQAVSSEKMNLALRTKLWKKIISTRQSVYDADNGEGMVSRVTSDCDYASKFFTMLLSIVSLLITTVVYAAAMYRINTKMANYALIFVPVSLVLGWIFAVLSYLVNYRVQKALAGSTAYLVERTKDMNLIKTSNAQEKELRHGKEVFLQQYHAQLRFGYVTAVSTVFSSLLELLGIALPFLVGASFVANGEITIGMLITFSGLFGNIRSSFYNAMTYFGNINAANGAIARVRRFFDSPEEQPEEGAAINPGEDKDFSFENVVFSYEDRDVLKDISCRIPKGRVTAVIGSNGSGKSTLFKLLVRLYDPKSGTIRFGCDDIRQYSLHSWRNQVCLIAQGAPMMAGTVRENICYGRDDDVSEEELMETARLSHVWDFVKELPGGFDAPVEAGGENFSGGQRQCIAIARAMMSRAPYLLLDESTSNLDARREADVMEALHTLMKDRTTLVIAHSVAAIKDADYVIVLRNGQLESSGTPKEILAQTDNYLAALMRRGKSVQTA